MTIESWAAEPNAKMLQLYIVRRLTSDIYSDNHGVDVVCGLLRKHSTTYEIIKKAIHCARGC